MYAQSFLVTSVRGTALLPITSDSAGLGVIGFMNAAFGLRADFFAVFLAIFSPSRGSPLGLPYTLARGDPMPRAARVARSLSLARRGFLTVARRVTQFLSVFPLETAIPHRRNRCGGQVAD